MKLSVIILAKTNSFYLFQMTNNCIHSLLQSEKNTEMEIIIVESNKNYFENEFKYPDFVKIIIPNDEFNFHKFLNIGINNATGSFIALCNNDLIFHDNWFSEIYKVSLKEKNVLSFSPNGKPCEALQKDKYEFGYKIMFHIKGWCIVVKKEIFNTIGMLDETFDFYYADNDYGLTLQYYNIKHILVYNSYVKHLERPPKILNFDERPVNNFEHKYKIPDFLNKKEYNWIFGNEKYLSGILKYHNKWGNPILLYRKIKLADFLISKKLSFLIRLFFKFK